MAREKNLSVLMSLHELDLAGRISDQIACIKGDRIDRVGSPEEIFTPGYIRELYGITAGTYDERTGNLEFPAVCGKPEVLVIAGNGSGITMFRRLQRAGIPFAAGILWENDTDYLPAKALASEVVGVAPFGSITDKELNRMKDLTDQCRQVICMLDPKQMIGTAEQLKQILVYAKKKEKLKYFVQLEGI